WTSTLDSGARLVLPLLDDFQWPARPVLICPDSDAWREGKEQHILSGFFALAKDLQARGAFVQFVMLPDLHGAKTGLDDWLKEPGNTVEHAWPQLPRLALDHARFRALTAWWQGWKEKQATQEALKSRHADEPVVDATGGVYTVTSPTYHTRFILTRLHESSRAVTAELAVLIETVEVSSGVTLSLTSDSSREQICKSLKAIESRLPWKVLIQKACAAVLKRHRTGEPLITLSTARPVEHVSFLINPFLYQRKITVIFGDGGLGKSTFGLLLAMVCATGETVSGVGAVGKTRPLYLDFEDDSDIHTQRLHAIAQAHPELSKAEVLYKRCAEPLPLLVPELLAQIAKERIGA